MIQKSRHRTETIVVGIVGPIHIVTSYCTFPVAYLGFHFGGGFKFFREKWGYLHKNNS